MRAKGLYLLLVVQVFLLICFFSYRQAGLGSPVFLLKTMPVDPRDYLRGDYIILRYEISELPARFKAEDFPQSAVYVTLQQQDDNFWVIRDVLAWEPSDGTPFLKAKLEGTRLLYDMEKYFVPEGKGNPPGKLSVEAAVRPDGRAQIKHLYSDGKPWP